MIQHITSASNFTGAPNLGSGPFDNFKFTLPHAVGAGNCLVLGLVYPHGNTPTITDTQSNSWPGTPTVSADGGSGKFVSALFVLPNAAAGVTTFTVAFGAGTLPFQYTLTEFQGIATASPVNGSQGTANVAGSTLTCGSFTPTNNDAGGGNLIYSYFGISNYSTIAQNPSAWSGYTGSSILDADTAWTNVSGVPHASQYSVQSTTAAINPQMTATGVTTNSYNCVAVALKVNNAAGTAKPAGIHIDRLIHQTTTQATTGGAAPSPLTIQMPMTGNLRVINITNSVAQSGVTVTDSEGNTWTAVPSPLNNAFFYQANCTANPNLTITITGLNSGSAGFQWYNSYRIYDISGAAASPFAGSSTGTSSGSSPYSSEPSITPTAAPGVTLAWIGLNVAAPPFTVTPAGAIIDVCQYTNQNDGDCMDNADGLAHLFHATTSAQNWTWTEASGASPVWSVAVAFKS